MTERAEHTAFTPGPWAATTRRGSSDWLVYSVADPNIEICQTFHDGTEFNEVGEANSKLIAAAPDLLAACQDFVRKVECGEANGWPDGEWSEPDWGAWRNRTKLNPVGLSRTAFEEEADFLLKEVQPALSKPAPVAANASAELQNDLGEMLRALGMSDAAQPKSPHEVFQSALAEMKRQLTNASAENYRDAIDEALAGC